MAMYKTQKSPDAAEKSVASDPTSVLKQDFREFACKTWHLEPTVRYRKTYMVNLMKFIYIYITRFNS